MKTSTSSRLRGLRFRTLLLMIGVFSGSLEGSSKALEPQLSGLVQMDGSVYASLMSKTDPGARSGWIKVGGTWADMTLERVSMTEGTALLRSSSGESFIVRLSSTRTQPEARNAAREEKLVPLEALDWAWIRSEANEMRDRIVEIPDDVALVWQSMPEAERIRIQNYYRLRGIDAGVERRGNIIHVRHQRIPDPHAPKPDSSQLKPVGPVLEKSRLQPPLKRNDN